jgi:CDP-diacylglycerol--glycerol-3-phosphate 3-phosphatidyltransferase
MISVYQLKPRFQALLQPVLRRLRHWGFTPNSLTIIAFLLSLAMGCYCFYGARQIALFLVPACLLLRMALNALDGMMARQFNLQSKLGAVLNEMGDLLSDAVLYYSVLYVLFDMNPIWVGWFIFLSILNEFAGLLGQALGGERRYDGPMGKSDRALVIGLLCLLIGFGLPSFYLLNTAVWIIIFGLLIWSTLKRLKHAL